MKNLEFWREMRSELERPPEAGKYGLKFAGEPEFYDHEFDCPDCCRTYRAHGVSFGPYDESYSLPEHWSFGCPALKHRLWRFWHHHGIGLWWSRRAIPKLKP